MTSGLSSLQQAQPIAKHFGAPGEAAWFTASITILTVVLAPMIAQASDYWSRKWPLVILTFAGVIGSIVISRANTIDAVIAGFTINGIPNAAQPLFHIITS